jgi:hypothetical protein
MELQLNNYQIKMLAAIFMVFDHIGVVFFPKNQLFRLIGRLSFPLFAWLLTRGERYTRSFGQYLLRLFFLGLISEPLYLLALSGTRLNILFTLSLGLITLRLSRRFAPYQYLIWGLGIVTAELLRVEYGAYGIAAIYLFAVFRSSPVWWAAWIGLHLLLIAVSAEFGWFQLPAVVAGLLVNLANHQKGPSARWFYSFYPLHLLVLYFISRLLPRWLPVVLSN